MHSFQNCIVWLIPNHPPPLETRIWKLVVRALQVTLSNSFSVLLKIDVYEDEHFFCWAIRQFNAFIKDQSVIKLVNVAGAVRNSKLISAFSGKLLTMQKNSLYGRF